ncbi:hypothetical protein JKP88DRAFT_225684 [Tribonema minus]|uniref:Secreted protein n=1 Tax=Tribonema minus TaxID=303371 RepID=A0A835YMF3_9STRA|nr:hypothetical protein JKP88DRAFT_225684 [Tribonema minus]
MLLALRVRLHLVHLQICPAYAYMTVMHINCMTPLDVLSAHPKSPCPPTPPPQCTHSHQISTCRLTHIRYQHVVPEAVANWLLDQHRN